MPTVSWISTKFVRLTGMLFITLLYIDCMAPKFNFDSLKIAIHSIHHTVFLLTIFRMVLCSPQVNLRDAQRRKLFFADRVLKCLQTDQTAFIRKFPATEGMFQQWEIVAHRVTLQTMTDGECITASDALTTSIRRMPDIANTLRMNSLVIL